MSESNTPLVSAVIVSYNRRDDLRETLQMLCQQNYKNIEIIVVDNASADGTDEMIGGLGLSNLRLIQMEKNLGVKAYNMGFEAARGEYILILDDDSFPAHNALERMIDKFNRYPAIGIISFTVKDYSTFKDSPDVTDSNEQEPAFSDDYIMSFHGAGAGVRREVLKKAGGYPEEFFLYFNETDMALRVWNAGFRIESFPDIVCFHKSSQINRTSTRGPFYYTRNIFWVIWKNYPGVLMWKATLLMLYYVFYYSFEQRTLIYIRALFDAVINAGKITRSPIQIAKRFRMHYKTPFTMYR
ncbi:glycosyltransferase family 2 protein [Candidatus Magnetominusculus xianensis]|uniref:Glycosyl transferase n=1 Tax=Candidatus Magnetominusculus xianensis TaxID=1748249 RepID=A0ABR5SJT3_9BACT|nr:glycosyltransferase family 2 protein [Candidatus Magnetominusculus xianensis]KWT95095.1 glycosyl transferase [Candidatus Magnetominusculus xianensis]MBF0402743.1 glycosyltransferase family 2 protein [Nitrospirota bacterium]